jgi:hypothetical protein
MAVAFDAVGPSSAGAVVVSPATTISWTHTNVGADVALLVAVVVGASVDSGRSVSVKLDPAGANTDIPSLGAAIHSNGGTAGFVALFGLPGVSDGAHTVEATLAGGSAESMEAGSVSYTGADGTTAFGTQQSATGTGTGPTITFTGSTAGNMVGGGLANGLAIDSAFTGTSRWIRNDNINSAAGNGAQADIAAGGSVVLTWQVNSDWYGIAAVEVLAAPASPLEEGPQMVIHRSNLRLG